MTVYALEDSGHGRYHGVNLAQRLELDFDRDGARLKRLQANVGLLLTGYGYGNRLLVPLKASPTASRAAVWAQVDTGTILGTVKEGR